MNCSFQWRIYRMCVLNHWYFYFQDHWLQLWGKLERRFIYIVFHFFPYLILIRTCSKNDHPWWSWCPFPFCWKGNIILMISLQRFTKYGVVTHFNCSNYTKTVNQYFWFNFNQLRIAFKLLQTKNSHYTAYLI